MAGGNERTVPHPASTAQWFAINSSKVDVNSGNETRTVGKKTTVFTILNILLLDPRLKVSHY